MESKTPMEKHTSCINIATVESYIESILKEVPYDRLFKGIVGNDEFLVTDEKTGRVLPVNQSYLLNPNNWVCNKVLTTFFKNVVTVLEDPNAIYKAGKNIFKTAIGPKFVLMQLIGVKAIVNRLPKENAKFNRNKSVEITQNEKSYAIIRLKWKDDPGLSKYSCSFNRGVYEGLGTLSRNQVFVEEKSCYFEGGDYCEFHIKWKSKPFFSRFFDVLRLWASREIINELETKIEEINDIRINQDKIIESRTRELKETQAKLIETEKRTLEHRITGGFAHEMRNALSGAQLEFKTILNYQNQGKPSTGMLKESATTLLKNISLLHEEYQIPREKIASLFLPQLKTIAEIADHLADVHAGVSSDLDRGLSITNQIREYARMSEFKKGEEPVDLVSLLKDYENRYRQEFERIGITYTLEGLETAIVKANETHINSIFSNLVLNAKDALEEQDAENKVITISVEKTDKSGLKQLIIKVEDNGPGIPEDKLTEIFEPFFSTKPTTGTGLGLGIVKRLVQLYDGKIEVESKVGTGTVFRITLPEA